MPIAGQSPKEVIHTELHKFKHGQLHSGSHHGPLVKNRKQAIAIALSESRKARADGGALMPVPAMPTFRDRLRPEEGNVEDRRGYSGTPEMLRLHGVMAGMGLPVGEGTIGSGRRGRLERESGLYDIGHRPLKARAEGGDVLAEPDEIAGLGSGSLMPVLSHYPIGSQEVSAPISSRLPDMSGEVEDRRKDRESGYEHMLAANQRVRILWRAILGLDPYGGEKPSTLQFPEEPPGKLAYDAGLYDIGRSSRHAPGKALGGPMGEGGGTLASMMSGLEASGMSPNMAPWAMAALAPEAEMGLLGQPDQAQYGGIPGVAAPQGPASAPGQAPVFSSPGVAPSFSPATPSGSGPASPPPATGWAQPSFAGGQWSNTPGKALGGPMGATAQMIRRPPMGGLGAAMPRAPAVGRGFPHAMARDLGGLIGAPNPKWMERNEARSMLHSGPISSIVPGRTDRHNVHVGSGSYVLPADAVSHIGQNNTKAGQAILGHMFGKAGPYGAGLPSIKHGSTMPKPGKAAPAIPATHLPKFTSAGGGKDGHSTGEPVPVVVAGGEFTIPPEIVANIGGGDIKRGHRILDNWVLSLRKKHIATLRGLPPPAKS